MTVCIAASCFEDEENPCIVLCRDWRGEVQGVGSADTFSKIRRLSSTWITLLANNMQRAEELIIRFEDHLRTVSLTEVNFPDEVRKVFSKYKKDMADSFSKNKYGFDLKTLVDKGKSAFGDDFTSTCFEEISKLPVDADLLICGFVEKYDYEDKKHRMAPVMCSVSERNVGDPVVLEYEFAAIGSGCDIARSLMFTRELDSGDPLMRVIYVVYEAKALSETVPGVGPAFSLDILRQDGTLESLSDTGFQRCRKMYSNFGLKPIITGRLKKIFDIKPEYFQPFAYDDDSDKSALPTPPAKKQKSTTPSDSQTSEGQQ